MYQVIDAVTADQSEIAAHHNQPSAGAVTPVGGFDFDLTLILLSFFVVTDLPPCLVAANFFAFVF